MGIFGDMMGDVFGSQSSPASEKPSGGLMDTLFGGFSPTGHVSGGSAGGSSWIDTMFDGYRVDPPVPRQQPGSRQPEVGLGGYREPILPAASQAIGYGGQPYDTQAEADKSSLMSGKVFDRDTGLYGTPQEIYDAYLREGRNTAPLLRRFGKNTFR